jgi:tight adherence protein C
MTALATQVGTLSLGLLSLALLLLAGLLIGAEIRRSRRSEVIGRAIRRGSETTVDGAAPPRSAQPLAGDAADPWPAAAAPSGLELRRHWLDSRLGRMLVADEDRRLIDQCGFPAVRAQVLFLVLRVALALALPLVAALGWTSTPLGRGDVVVLAAAFALGFMAPKWLLSGFAVGRRERVAHELPLFVDLLRLLQGVGLSLDQSLLIMAAEFSHVLQVLGHELTLANRQYGQGRTREHSLQRLAGVYANDNLAALMGLLVQIDRHGGAVQEPLRQFSERLREHRRAELKERIGKITVKMTGVMVTTLLPALIIVTAGPGFLAIVRSLGAMAK